MPDYSLLWGDTHDNVYQRANSPVTPEENLAFARSHLDFYAPAYYTAESSIVDGKDATANHGAAAPAAGGARRGAMHVEDWKPPERLDREWRELQDLTKQFNDPGAFVTFPGYEWQGNGTSGDHNVVYRAEGNPVFTVDTLTELYARLRGLDAIAIPHHTAYPRGARGKDWSVHDDELSPFAEVFSVHGCSETDEERPGLLNGKMGPARGGGTYEDALARGHHVGAIGSTDQVGTFPGRYGWGLMGCLAEDLSRESLWQAFKRRRVYGVTGDRMRLDFRVDDAMMGDIVSHRGPREVRASVVGSDAIDRIEVLRDGRVIHTYCHQGVWDVPRPGQRSRFKLRIEVGWGPYAQEIARPPKRWQGALTLPAGAAFLGWEPCWVRQGQERPTLRGREAAFTLISQQATPGHQPLGGYRNANVFEFEAAAGDELAVAINGLEAAGPVADFCRGSRVLWDEREALAMLEAHFGLSAASLPRPTFGHHLAYKAKLHRVIPEAGYSASLSLVDDSPVTQETHYRVRVEQRNGQRAWSSPIWVRPQA